MNAQTFGVRLRELRRKAGLTQRQLAEKVGVDFTYLSKIENGVLPPPSEKVIERLTEVLKAEKDELITLAGRIPSDIVPMLRSREALKLLRSERVRRKVAASAKKGGVVPMMKIDWKNLGRVAVAITLVLAIGVSLWFSGPIPVRAFGISASVANSAISGNTTYLLGEKIGIPLGIQFAASENKSFQTVNLTVAGPETFTKSLPLVPGTYQYGTAQGIPGTLDVVVGWTTGIVGPTGYGYYGYGYSPGTGNITYSVQWTPPYALTTSPPSPPSALPLADYKFDITMSESDLSATSASTGYPQGLAWDRGNNVLYLLLPASYTYFSGNATLTKDIIIKTNLNGNYIGFIPAPGDYWQTEAITFIGSTLYAAYNEWDSTTWTVKGKVAKYVSDNWTTISGLSNLNPIGGLASDGTSLFVAFRDQLTIQKRDPTTGAQIGTSFDLSQAWGGGGGGPGPGPMGPPIWGFDALAYSTALYAAQGETIVKVNASTGAKEAEYPTGKWSIRGLEFVSENFSATAYDLLYLATTEWPGKVYRAAKPGEVPVIEGTPIGNYQTEFRVVADGNTYTDTDNFTLTKLTTAPAVTIAAPIQNFAVAAGEETITVSGSINDPSITTVTVGVQLPEVTAFADNVETANVTLAKWEHSAVAGMMPWMTYDGTADLWHRSNVRDHTGGSSWSWRYANPGIAGTYDTGYLANAGALKTKNKISIGDDNKLTFWTWYDGELDFWPDRKRVEVSTDNGTTWTLVAWLAKFWPPFTPPDIPSSEFQKLYFVPERTWTKVEVSLTAFAGQDVYLRFRFDTMDGINNSFEGWYIDDLSITGAGFLGVPVSVDADREFSTSFTLGEGSNAITVTARRTAYEPILSGSSSVSGSLDTVTPIVVLNPVTTPTNQAYQIISGNVTEANFDRLELSVNNVVKWSTKVLGSGNTFSQSILLSEGSNNILVEVRDKVALTANATALVKLDTVGPVFEDVFTSQYDVAYKTGEVSARVNDFFFIALKVTDNASDVGWVKLITPMAQSEADWASAMKKTDMPEAVIDSWGIEAATKSALNYVLPMQLPSGAPAGDYNWTVVARDTAGNSSNLTVSTRVVTTLEAFNIYLMPDWNLVSTPLIPTTTNITTLTANITASELFERVWYYDAFSANTSGEWKVYVPGVGGDLTTLTAGKGYWFKMKPLTHTTNTSAIDSFTEAGKVSGPMATGLPNTPAPIKLSIPGWVLQPGAVVPPSYAVYAGWNLIGLHSEYSLPVSTAFTSVSVPQQKWGSLLQYLNYIEFPMRQEQAQPEIDLGRFARLISTGTMQPGRGFWLYMVEAGTLVP